MQLSLRELVAARPSWDGPVQCFTTHRSFDEDYQTEWKTAGEQLASALSGDFAQVSIWFAGQIHSGEVTHVSSTFGFPQLNKAPSCDGLITNEENTVLVIRTADCVPVVAADQKNRVAGVAHAGWKGTLVNITGNLVQKMLNAGASEENLKVWIGPSISGEVYEVSPEMIEQFNDQFAHLGSFAKGRYLNLPRLNLLQAEAFGLKPENLQSSDCCTYSHEEIFHSHRRNGRNRGHLYTICGILPSEEHPPIFDSAGLI